MSGKIHWKLLILFVILCQGIIGILSENNIVDESSELLVRQKRVINISPGEELIEHIKNFPFVVSFKRFRFDDKCVGVIMTQHIVLTAAKCVEPVDAKFKVYSGSSHAVIPSSHAIVHNVTEIRKFRGHIRFRQNDGVALATVNPPFVYSINTHNIEIYHGPIFPGLYVTIPGWGCNTEGHPGTAHPSRLRSITVPIISNHDCAILYLNALPIVNTDICTFDAIGQKYCTVEDTGAPLVIEVNHRNYLAGIHLWNGGIIGRPNPDVFINLQEPMYKNWILENIRSMEARVHQ